MRKRQWVSLMATAIGLGAVAMGSGAYRGDAWAGEASPPKTTPVQAILEASLDLPNLSWLAVQGRFVWVKRDDGFVERIDPRTNRSTGRVGQFTGQDTYCQGIGAGGGAVWSCTQRAVTRIDVQRVRIVARIAAGKVFAQGRLVYGHRRLWIVGGTNADELVGIDPATNRPGRPIKLHSSCTDLAQGVTRWIWVLCPLSNKVLKVDVDRHRVVGKLALTESNAAFATTTDLWAGSAEGLVRVQVGSLRVRARFGGLDPGDTGDVVVDGSNVWVRTSSRFLDRIDARTNKVVEHMKADPSFGGGSLAIADGSLWTTADDVSKLLRLRRDGR